MSVLEIICGVLLILISIFIVAITIGQTQKQQGMTSAIGGGNNDSFYDKNRSNTKEHALERLTKIMTVLFFILVIGVNVIEAITGKVSG